MKIKLCDHCLEEFYGITHYPFCSLKCELKSLQSDDKVPYLKAIDVGSKANNINYKDLLKEGREK
jgi:hypothetical protein